MEIPYRAALAEIAAVTDALDPVAVDRACTMIAEARTVLVHGCGRELLQLKGFAMRLGHLGARVWIRGDVTAPPIGPGDLLIAAAGPGELASVAAVMRLARGAGARVLFLTAAPETPSSAFADHVLTIPAQTMADDQGPAVRSVLPMGSVFEGALFILFEGMVLDLRDRLGQSPDAMRARHANLE